MVLGSDKISNCIISKKATYDICLVCMVIIPTAFFRPGRPILTCAILPNYLLPLLCGFRNGHNPQHALVRMLEKWKKSLDKGPLFFNIYINDFLLSLMDTDICNYADDTTIYACDKNLNNVIARLENDSSITIQWFADNFTNLNTNKCHLRILGRSSHQKVKVNVGDSIITNSEEEKLLGVVIDKRLSFETHISKLCKKADNKLSALARISGYMDTTKLKILMRAFVISQFEYCPLVWMFHSRHLNSKINNIHERALKIAYKDYDSSFNTLLEKDDSVNIHVKHLRNLMIEIFKTRGNINPPFMREIFCERHAVYNLRNNNEFMVPRVRTTCYGTETIKNIEGSVFGSLYLST